MLKTLFLAFWCLSFLFTGLVCMAAEFIPSIAQVTLTSDKAHPGDTLYADYKFIISGTPPTGDWMVFVHLRPHGAAVIDTPPMSGADFVPMIPLSLWKPDATVLEPGHAVPIPGDFTPGKYDIYLGIYDRSTGERATFGNTGTVTDDNRTLLGTIEVVPANVPVTYEPVTWELADASGIPDLWTALKNANAETLAIKGDNFSVILDAVMPRIISYDIDRNTINGDGLNLPLRVRIGIDKADRFFNLILDAPDYFVCTRTGDEIRYATTVIWDGQNIATFDVVFKAHEDTLKVSIENIEEAPGFLLMDVWLPQLMSVTGADEAMMLPTQGGRLVSPANSRPGEHVVTMNWFESDLCGGVVGDGCALGIRSRDWDNELVAQVLGPQDELCAGYTPHFALRAEAFGDAAKIQLATNPAFEILSVKDNNSDGVVNWVDVAHRLRADLTGSPNPFYKDTIIYKIFCDAPGSNDFTTFDEAVDIVRRVHQIAPWLKQVAYLVGWQYEGHDTGYPATDKINERLGGIAGLKKAIADARQYNALLSFHDNIDDAYPASPMWDNDIIAHDNHNNAMLGGVWSGGQSYIIAPGKYAKKSALERVRRTVSQMPVQDSYHIDVLSAVPKRWDYNPDAPENSAISLAGKTAIVQEFNRFGVDVTSEGFVAPLVGVIGHSWHFWHNWSQVFAGEERIPFIAMIYHGGPTTWGNGGQNGFYPQESALHGATFSTDWTKHIDDKTIAWATYLVVAPWNALRERKMQNYQYEGDVQRVIYDENTWVEVNSITGEWTVMVDGKILVKDDVVTLVREDMIALYSEKDAEVSCEIPPALQGRELVCRSAFSGEEVMAKINDNQVTVSLRAKEPVLVQPQ